MRDIKFRAWDKEREYFIGNSGVFINGIGSIYVQDMHYGTINKIDDDSIDIMLYTGEQDSNGKDVYERDVFLDKVNEAYGIVIFKDGCFGIQWYGIDGYLSESGWDESGEFGELDFEPLNLINIDNMEIAGNTYKNPELLS